MSMKKDCPHDSRVSCSDCVLNTICLPIALESEDIERLDEIVARGKPLQKGDHLYRQEDEFSSIFAVRSGSIKAYTVSDDGKELVTGFYFPGEILGMDGIGRNRHASSAKAMETSSICEIPFGNLGELSQEIPSLQQHCFQLMSQEIVDDRQLLALLSKSNAEERVATFLLSISARKARHRLSATNFRLTMSRSDMGNYLGLTVETISRVLSKFQKSGMLAVDNKEISIIDMAALRTTSAVKDDELICKSSASG